jgi:hypothetical protein
MQRLLLTKGENADGNVYFHDYKLFFVRGAARPSGLRTQHNVAMQRAKAHHRCV